MTTTMAIENEPPSAAASDASETFNADIDGVVPEDEDDVASFGNGFPAASDPSSCRPATFLAAENSRSRQPFVPRIHDGSPRIRPRPLEVLQRFEGLVMRVGEETFDAELADLTDPSRPEEYVELPVEEVSVSDRELLAEGAVFYWTIGYETSRGGSIRRVSEIHMKRTPRWTEREIANLRERAEAWLEQMNAECDARSPET